MLGKARRTNSKELLEADLYLEIFPFVLCVFVIGPQMSYILSECRHDSLWTHIWRHQDYSVCNILLFHFPIWWGAPHLKVILQGICENPVLYLEGVDKKNAHINKWLVNKEI